MCIQLGHPLLRNFIIICPILFIIFVLSPFDSVAQIKLAWDPEVDPSVIGYKIYYGTDSRTYGTPINVGNLTTYTLNGLTPGITYYIAVTAYNTVYESDYSNEVSGTINETVSAPNVLGGPTSGTTGTPYSYTTGGSVSSLGNPVQYQFDWKGDGTDLSLWGSSTEAKTWTSAGSYNVRARAGSTVNTGVISNWSGSFSVEISTFTISGTVTTNPSGLQITVDGSTYTAPQSFSWAVGSFHIVSVPSPQSGPSGVRYVFSSWSDGATQSHTIIAPSSNATYTANLSIQYSLTTSVNPAEGGTVDPSGVTWFNSGQKVSISSRGKLGYKFIGWSGDLSGIVNPASIIVDSPKNVVSNLSKRSK